MSATAEPASGPGRKTGRETGRSAAGAVGRARERGQALVLVALSLVVLLGMAAVAIDAGRFMTQRRFVQNAADAAALAAANVVVNQSTATVGTARQAARTVLAVDLAGSPVGAPSFAAADPPVFNGATYGPNLADGIVLTDSSGTPLPDSAALDSVSDVRVALSGPVSFTFGRVVGITTGTVSATAHVGFSGDLMPIAVRRYYGAPGPDPAPPNPCPEPPDSSAFTDLAASQATSCTGQVDGTNPLGYDVRTPASATSPGPTVPLVGQAATAANNSSFRGFVALDIRNYEDQFSRVYYNNVTSGTQPNALKNMESGWVTNPLGYPGPDFPPITAPPDPNDQVGIMDGTSAGIVVSDLESKYHVGDRILCALYDGTVMTIPDFTLNPPSPVSLTAGAAPKSGGTFKVSRNQAFTGTVALSTVGAPAWLSLGYSPNPVTPSQGSGTTVTMTNAAAAAGTPAQIATFWIEGQAGSPYLTAHHQPVAVNVGNVSQDFAISLSPDQAPTNWGDQLTYTLTFTTAASGNFPAPLNVTLDGSGAAYAALAAGSYWFDGVQGQTSATVAMTSGSHGSYSGSVTLTINTTALGAQATYPFVVSATGTNAAGQPVAHEAVGKVLASATADDSKYVDIIGFGVYQITSMSDPNTVYGQLVSAVKPTATDPALRSALTPRLRPW